MISIASTFECNNIVSKQLLIVWPHQMHYVPSDCFHGEHIKAKLNELTKCRNDQKNNLQCLEMQFTHNSLLYFPKKIKLKRHTHALHHTRLSIRAALMPIPKCHSVVAQTVRCTRTQAHGRHFSSSSSLRFGCSKTIITANRVDTVTHTRESCDEYV